MITADTKSLLFTNLHILLNSKSLTVKLILTRNCNFLKFMNIFKIGVKPIKE